MLQKEICSIFLTVWIGTNLCWAIKEESHHVSIDLNHNLANPVLKLPSNGFTEYSFAYPNKNHSFFKLTPHGEIYGLQTINDMGMLSIPLRITSRNLLNGDLTNYHLFMEIFDEIDTMLHNNNILKSRVKRMTNLVINKEVKETVNEIVLDYAAAGVPATSDKQYYLIGNPNSVPIFVDLRTGRIILSSSSKRLDYETIANHQFVVIIYVNSTVSALDYNITAQINLLDVNDEPPMFTMQPKPYLAVVDPYVAPGSLVNFQITSVDADANSALTYTIISGVSDFRLDQYGRLYTTKEMIRGKEYVVRVQVEDANAVEYKPQIDVAEIRILADKRPPQFYKLSYEGFIPENTPPAQLDLLIKAKSFQGDAISFVLQNSDYIKLSSVSNEPNEVSVQTTAMLDYEADPTSFNLILTATERESGLSSSVLVTIRVIDVNDNAPRFDISEYVDSKSWPEDSAIGTLITSVRATDMDPSASANGQIEYIIEPDAGQPNVPFYVETRSISNGYEGLIKVAGPLDYEAVGNTGYRFKVKALDKGNPARSGIAYVRVRVINTNDKAPLFQSTRIERIEATKAVNSIVTTVVASDPDGDNVAYSIVTGGNAPFSINSQTGTIVLTSDLSSNAYINISAFTLNISATDDGSCCIPVKAKKNTGYTLVIIEIVGRNHAPTFPRCESYSKSASVSEQTSGAFVVQVQAADEDSGPNGDLSYSLVNDLKKEFVIDRRTGVIKTAVDTIDREATSQKILTVKAEDGALSKLSTFCTFTVVINDLNDNAPRLLLAPSQDAQVNSPPNTPIYNLYAVDPDLGPNGTMGITWNVSSNPNFYTKDNILFNRVSLTSSMASPQMMTITARDGGGMNTSASFTVYIKQTASPPRFIDVPLDNFAILENATDDTIIYKIKAAAADGGPVNYFIVPTTTMDAFYERADDSDCKASNSLCLAVYKSQKLDADNMMYYSIRVRVTPQSQGSNVVAEKTISITLLDVNDNIPEFQNKDDNGYIMGSVYEDSNVNGQVVTNLIANDSDITPSFKTKRYSIEPGLDSQLFVINSDTGAISVATNTPFDRETKAQYFIKVRAVDGAPSSRPALKGAPNSQIADVQINIADVNDNPPEFPQKQYNATVEETAARGTLVINVAAMDKDIENNFQYFITQGNVKDAFVITNTGDILVLNNAGLDFETLIIYNLVVQVSDGRFQAQTSVHIQLIDMNDNAPEFTRTVYEVSSVVEEDSTISPASPKFLVKVSATDSDKSRPTRITYDLSGSYSDYFQINSETGEVFLVKPLDRDTQPTYDVNVLANDEPNTPTNRIGYAIVSVSPQDINDNSPVFDIDTLTGTVPENQTIGRLFMTVMASDKDVGNNGSIRFMLKPNTTKPFSPFLIGEYPYFNVTSSGTILTRAIFDREAVDTYTLEIIAYDLGIPNSLSSTATVTIKIGDVNDNPPSFTPRFYQKSVSELAGPFSFLLDTEAKDPDVDDELVYSLDSQAVKNFSIDRSGSIYLRDVPLDYEYFYERSLQPIINITVNVTDSEGRHSASCVVQLKVIDENDETPVFRLSTVSVNVLENITVNTFLATMTATDRDAKSTPINSQIEYLISRTLGSDVDRYFSINNKTGEVRTWKLLDRETLRSHTIVVLGVDHGSPFRRTGTATLIVNLIDIDDNGPRLATPTVYIPENMPVSINTIPKEITAVDDDDNDVGNGPPFRMSPTNGSQNSLDFDFIFHNDWDIPDGLTVANGAGELRSKRVLDREGMNGPVIRYYLDLYDRQNVTSLGVVNIVIADEDDNPPSAGIKHSLIYNYKSGYQVVEIGDCPAVDKDDWDKPYKSYEKVGSWPKGFVIDEKTGMITADLRVVPSGVYNMQCKVIDNYIANPECAYNCNVRGGSAAQMEACKTNLCRTKVEAISSVKATIKTIDNSVVWNAVSIRVQGSSVDFIQKGPDGLSAYDKLAVHLAKQLGTDASNVDIFSVLDSQILPGYVDVRFAAHGSPYYNSSKLIAAIEADSQISEYIGKTIAQVPINYCIKEICDAGCYNQLIIDDEPTLVNANGSSIVGVASRIEPQCGCEMQPKTTNVCNPHSCLNGGTCSFNVESRTTSCTCPNGFDGPRCQQLRHSFTGNGWAQYKTLSQCANSSTSLEVITKQFSALILYNGLRTNPGDELDSLTDYIAVTIADGKPAVYINFGTGYVKLAVQKAINDGFWHKLEITFTDRVVSLTVDDCQGLSVPYQDSDTSVIENLSLCRDTQTAPGENRLLNVASLLELGGRSVNEEWPFEVSSKNYFNGCVRNLKHNGELYDLHIGGVGHHLNSQDGCPREDAVCTSSDGSPRCGSNAVCEASLDGAYTCVCKAGWTGEKCELATEYVDFSEKSFIEWQIVGKCQGMQCEQQSFKTDIQLTFRTRDQDGSGVFFYVKGNESEYIKLQLVAGQVQLRYDIGSDSLHTSVRERILYIPVNVTDGALHTVKVTRVGKRFTLQLDGGEGINTAQSEDFYSHQLFVADDRIFSGGDGSFTSTGAGTSDLENTCITDIRFNGYWLPLNEKESSLTSAVRLVRRQNVVDGCHSAACLNVNCPDKQVCHDRWRKHECLCPKGYMTLYAAPYCQDIDECFPDNPCLNGDCTNSEGSFMCTCHLDSKTGERWQGEICQSKPQPSVLRLSDSGIVGIVVAVLLALLMAIAIFCFVTRWRMHQKLAQLYDSYDDIRETIYNYDEEGMPEEDQHSYDISRLCKPINPVEQEPFEAQAFDPLSNVHQPDVGDFINSRLNDADGEESQTPDEEYQEYEYEGQGSDAGSLSSLNSSSTCSDLDFDYLKDLGPKFSKLADMYSGGDAF